MVQFYKENRKKILILGSTGSVGSCAVDVIKNNPKLFYVDTIIAMGSNVKKLAQQAIDLKAKNVAIYNIKHKDELERLLFRKNIKTYFGQRAILDLVQNKFDITIAAISGIAGLEPIMAAIPNSNRIAIANKESIVCAQYLMFQYAKSHNTEILPIDSEHSALFQLLNYSANAEKIIDSINIRKLIITASGGPFLNFEQQALCNVTPEQACKHPTWSMGTKISIDSATLMNKALEIIETSQLFNVPIEKIDVVIHPESIVHAMVEYVDGTVLAQLSAQDMRISCAFALSYPQRLCISESSPYAFDISKYSKFSFFKSDVVSKFKTLPIAYRASSLGHAAVIAMSAANEYAVDAFLKHKIKFTQISQLIEYGISKYSHNKIHSIQDVLSLHNEVQRYIAEYILTQN